MTELLTFFIILIAGLVFSEVFKRLHLPYVSALIIAGIFAGPFALNLVEINPAMSFIGSIGIVFLMFIAGSEIKTNNLKGFRNKILILSLFNGLFPFLIGFGISYILGYSLFTSLVLGTIFISSSVGVIIPSLESLDLTSTNIGKSIIGSTVVEDLVSLLLLAFILQRANPITNIPLYFYIPLLLFIIILLKSIVPRLEKMYHKKKTGKDLFESELRFVFVVLIASVILFEILGMHSIIAGFITGMILSDSIRGKLIEKIRTISYGLFIPIFFFIIGIKMDLSVFTSASNIFLIAAIVIGAMTAKLISGFYGARFIGFSEKASFLIGLSTMPSLSTSLAAAFAALEFNLLTNELISAIIVFTIISTLLTPIFVYFSKKSCSYNDIQ